VWAEPSPNRVNINPFLSTFVFNIRSQTVGVACFNTAWRATGEPDDKDLGNLLIGERIMDYAIEKLGRVDIRLAVFHHPLNWLHPFDQTAVDGRLQAEFDILMCGHIHRSSPEWRRTTAGEVVLSQGAALYVSRDYFNGYNIVQITPSEDRVR